MNALASRGSAATASVQSRSASRSNCLLRIHSWRENRITAGGGGGGGGGGGAGGGGGGGGALTDCLKTAAVAPAA